MKIKVAGVHYEIKEVENLALNHGLYGQVIYQTQTIQIEKSLKADRKNETIIHELLHAILYEAGYEEQGDDMEELVTRAAKVLAQTLLENYISDYLKVNQDLEDFDDDKRDL